MRRQITEGVAVTVTDDFRVNGFSCSLNKTLERGGEVRACSVVH